MNKTILNNRLTAALSTLVIAAAFGPTASAIDYTTKAINAYDHTGKLVSTQIASDVQYIEVQDFNIDPKCFSISGSNGDRVYFNMIPVVGTKHYKIRSSQLQWDEEDKYSAIATFYIGETEVTNALWKAVMGQEPPSQVNTGYNFPVESVSWDDICKTDGFLDKLNALIKTQPGMDELLDEYQFCLPTEWEWEYAAYGGVDGIQSANNSGSGLDFAWNSSNSGNLTHEVAQKLPNGLGIYDMSGNVWEWCGDTQFRGSNGIFNPYMRPQRGGSYDTTQTLFYRTANSSSNRYKNLGFRLALKKKTLDTETYIVKTEQGEVKFKMISVTGCSSYKLKYSLIEWPEYEKYAEVPTFYIGETEVTNALWKAVMNTEVPSQNNKGDNYPVESVSWNDICKAGGFLEKLNELLSQDATMKKLLKGRKFYLPTEWEWEYAASGGRASAPFSYSGNNDATKVGWVKSNSGYTTHEVGKKSPNALGVYDMTGNVWELCAETQYKESSGYINAFMRPQRGGAFDSSKTIFERTGNESTAIFNNIGFRLILK